jgi:ATP-dependent RNA helicase DeaD
MNFNDFNFNKNLQKAINIVGFVEPSPIQQKAIPVVLKGSDIVAQAQTGTGKTAAFGLPTLQNMKCDGSVETIVIVPTRELAMQVSDELFRFGKFLNVKTATVYGGSSYQRQIKHIQNASIIVATPGRFLDLLKNKQIQIKPSFVILDEADEMMDMGFLEDIKAIFKFLPQKRQTLMFSATMPEPIKKLAKTILNNPKFITITKSEVTNTNIAQSFYVVEEHERDDALMRLFDYKNPHKSIVFCRTRRDVDRLATYLVSQGYSAKGLHGDMEQRQREEVIRAFKGNTLEVLVATDVAARGLDVSDVSHVFNYHLPFDSEPYVHRIGRTGRAGNQGIAISIVTPIEFKSLKKIQKDVGTTMQSKVIPTISDVKNKQQSNLIKKLQEQKINDKACEFIEELKADFDLSTIVYKLASYIRDTEKIKGKDKIGKSLSDIEKMLSKTKVNSNKNSNRNRKQRKNNKNNSNRNHRSRNKSKKG